MTTARGIRNRNPGNIVVSGWTQRQAGYTGPEPEGRFATFATMARGVEALMRLLLVYRENHGLRTIRGIINRWAPAVENDTGSYVLSVAKATGYGVDEELPATAEALVSVARAIVGHENGRSAAVAVTDEDYADAASAIFQQPAGATPSVAASTPPPIAAEPVSPPAPEPAPAAPLSTVTVESPMAIPAALVTAGASLLFDVVSDLFRARGTKTATRNAEIIEKAGPALVGVAQAITGEPKMEDAVRRVTENPADRQAYRLAIADDMDRIIGVVERLSEIDEASRDRAAERIKGDDSMAAATPLLIHFALGLLAGVIVLLVGVMGLQTWLMADHKPQPELIVLFVSIVSTMLGIVGTIYAYRFGSSAGSKASGDAVRAIAEARK